MTASGRMPRTRGTSKASTRTSRGRAGRRVGRGRGLHRPQVPHRALPDRARGRASSNALRRGSAAGHHPPVGRVGRVHAALRDRDGPRARAARLRVVRGPAATSGRATSATSCCRRPSTSRSPAPRSRSRGPQIAEQLARGCFDIVQPDAVICGGIGEALLLRGPGPTARGHDRAAHVRRRDRHRGGTPADRDCCRIRPACRPPTAPLLEVGTGENPWRTDVLATGWQLQDGWVDIPDRSRPRNRGGRGVRPPSCSRGPTCCRPMTGPEEGTRHGEDPVRAHRVRLHQPRLRGWTAHRPGAGRRARRDRRRHARPRAGRRVRRGGGGQRSRALSRATTSTP